MAKSSKKTQQSDEQKVLNVLKRQGDITLEQLEKKTGFSRQKLWRIKNSLKQNGTIWGYSAIDDSGKQNLSQFILLLKRSMKPFEEKFRNEVVKENLDSYLPGKVIIQDIYYTHGYFNAVINFQAKNIIDAKKLIDTIMIKLGDYFTEIQLLETLFPVRLRGIKNPNIEKLVEFI